MTKKLFVVGIGPGCESDMTIRAKQVLLDCDCIVGYTRYCDLVRPLFSDREFLSTPMTGEEERVRIALKRADQGYKTALICGGDAGIYGLAGLALKAAPDYPEVDVEIVSGITAASAGAAVLGAPLIHDFSVISLSDRLTPFDLIEKRLSAAAQSDMVIVLYNPGSTIRQDHLARACDILLLYLPPERICGLAANIGREGESKEVMTLSELKGREVDMFTTVFIGNSSTRRIDDLMVTARGYESER